MEKRGIEIKWGVLFILALLLWMYAERLFGIHDKHIDQHPLVSSFFALVALCLYLLALYDKRKNYYNGRMNWRQGFVAGLVMTLVIAILSPLAQYVISRFISPEFFPNMIRYSVETGEMTRDQAETYFGLENYMIQSVLFAIVSGVLTSAITALIMRRGEKGSHSASGQEQDLTGN